MNLSKFGSTVLIGMVAVVGGVVSGQPLPPATTTWTRNLLKATNSADFWSRAGYNYLSNSVNAEAYGAVHNGRVLRGSATSGSTNVTITTGTISAADVDSNVRVILGGGANDDVVTTVSAVDGTTLGLNKECTNTATVDLVIAATDDTAALQAAINAIRAKGGGVVDCPAGIYWIGGAVVDPGDSATKTNAQIWFGNLTGGDSYDQVIKIRGAASGQLRNYLTSNSRVPAGATVFWSGLEKGDGGAMFGAAPTFTNPKGRVIFEDLMINMPTDCDGTAIDGGWFHSMVTKGVLVTMSAFTEHDTRMPAPTHASVGLAFPRSGSYGGGTTLCEETMVCGGFFHGITFSEHFVALNVGVLNCVNAFSPTAAAANFMNYAVVESCITAFNMTNGTSCNWNVGGMHYENLIADRWFTSRTLIGDPNSASSGRIMGDFFVGGITNVGATNVDLVGFPSLPGTTRTVTKGTNDFMFSAATGLRFAPLSPSYGYPGHPEVIAITTNGGIIFKPNNSESQRAEYFFQNSYSSKSIDNMGLDIRIPAANTNIDFLAAFGSGSQNLGASFSWWPYYPGFGYNKAAMLLHTNGDLELTVGKFIGDGSGITGLPGGGDALLGGEQTWTGQNTFSNTTVFNGDAVFAGSVTISNATGTTSMDTLIVTNTASVGGLLTVDSISVVDAGVPEVAASFEPNTVDVPGLVQAYTFTGAGSNITALNASAVSSGTLPSARLGFASGLGAADSGTNFIVNPQTGMYQNIQATNDLNFACFTNGPGAVSIKIRPNGADRLLSFPTNWVPLYTNGLTLSGATWILTLTNAVGTTGPHAALFSAVADGTDPTNVIWGVQVSP